MRFVFIVGSAMVLFNALFYLRLSEDSLMGAYLRANARASALIVNASGEGAVVEGTILSSPRAALDIRPGCDGIQASAFFVFAVLASPAPLSLTARLPALILGVAALLAMNLLRIVALYYTRIFLPDQFDIIHVEVWQAVFIFLPIIFWMAWLRRTRPPARKRTDAGV